jgi:hypothetical protein
MKLSLLPLSASILLVSSIGVASAADHGAMSRQSSMSSTASMAKDNLSLTTAQQKTSVARPQQAGRESACAVKLLCIAGHHDSGQYRASSDTEKGCQSAPEIEALSVCTATERDSYREPD